MSSRIDILPTGIPAERFEAGDGGAFRRRHGLDPERPLLLFVGRAAHEKNIGFLLDMMLDLRNRRPDALLLIAGEGPAAPNLRAQAARLGLGDSVRFLGYFDRGGELQDCYSAADVFVFSSLTETQGLVLLEAMAQGVPVVAIPRMGTIDILGPGLGCRHAPDDRAGFAQVVFDPPGRWGYAQGAGGTGPRVCRELGLDQNGGAAVCALCQPPRQPLGPTKALRSYGACSGRSWRSGGRIDAAWGRPWCWRDGVLSFERPWSCHDAAAPPDVGSGLGAGRVALAAEATLALSPWRRV